MGYGVSSIKDREETTQILRKYAVYCSMPCMANTSSAKKANRVETRRRVFNLRRSKAMRDSVKDLMKTGNAESLAGAYQAIDKALKRGLIKRNTAARMKSRAAKRVAVK